VLAVVAFHTNAHLTQAKASSCPTANAAPTVKNEKWAQIFVKKKSYLKADLDFQRQIAIA
jgi:hypothetical protein